MSRADEFAFQPGRRVKRRPDFGTGDWAAVIVVSTAAAEGRAADTTGPLLAEWLTGHGYRVSEPIVVADGDPVRTALHRLLVDLPAGERPRFIFTTGGTGTNSDDTTPEATAEFIDRPAPGIMHALWAYGLQKLDEAMMSRGRAGLCGQTFICNLPGSPGGVRDGITVLDSVLHHLQAQLADVRDHDDSHRHPPQPAPASGPATGVVHTSITEDPLTDDAAAAVLSPQMGAVASFRGVIRNHDSGRDDVTGLDYTAHPQAGEILAATCAAVAQEFAAESGGVRIWAAHRIGSLAVGEDALVVAVAAAHRREAFACCAELVDRIKAEVPIWKQQHYATGGHDWVGIGS